MRGWGLVVWLGCGCSALRPAIPADTLAAWQPEGVEVVVDRWAVRGATIERLAQSLDRRAPWRDAEGDRYHAVTDWTLGWRWSTRPDVAGCAVVEPEVTLSLRFLAPAWRERPVEPTRVAWEAYAAGLWEHERGHAERAVAAAQALRQGLLALPSASDCLSADRAARALAAEAVEGLRQEQEVYDAATGHGRGQGARLRGLPGR